MTHTVHMDLPIRPGDARRLGLREPMPMPRALIVIDHPISEAHLERLLFMYRGAVELRAELLPEPAPRRRWWPRRNR